ncbi:MAG TPA: cobalamin ABC transporter substrate-binding protein, partial [Byssovorax sp.]
MRSLFLALLASVVSTSCVPAQRGASTASTLPRWEQHDREVYDDNIDPAAVGLSLEGPSAYADKFLRERAQTAEVVGYMRVDTVTVESVGDAKRFRLGVRVATPTLGKSKVEERDFELEVSAGNPLLGAGFEQRVRGKKFIGFIHRYADDMGESTVHFHLSADTPEVARAVQE